jgi:Ca2+-binding RTX toxin-like protein
MRSALILILSLLVCMTLASAAGAQVIEGTNSGDVLVGTDFGDKIYGYDDADTLKGKGGGDLLVGGSGADTIECGVGHDNPVTGRGEDMIFCSADDGKPDVVDCGAADDVVFWRVFGTVIFTNCEFAYHVTGSGDRIRVVSERP